MEIALIKLVFETHERLFTNGKKTTETGNPEFLFYLAILNREEHFKFFKKPKESRYSLPVNSSFTDIQI